MFTPQKNLWSLTTRSDSVQKNGSISGTGSGLNLISRSPRHGEASGKSKTVTFIENDGTMDQESLIEKVSKLENELFEYQYNMGLLLIEKKEWNVKYDEFQHGLAQMADTLKREQEAHSIAMSELEKREENLKKALGVERQCVLDLEKALREMRSEYAEIKFNTDSKVAEANALVCSVEEKSLEVEAKFHAADAKLAEVSRKSSEIERKFNELEAQENALRRERFFFTTERETHETTLSKQREDLREWEHKLKEGEERLADGRRLLNQREERANENDKILTKKQNDLEELQKKIEMANSTMKCKEDDINRRIASLSLKEKEADDVGKNLDMKEKQLLEWENKLNNREELEIQKQLDEHKTILEAKQKKFELELDQKRKFHDEQLKNKMVEVEKKEAEIIHMEEKVQKREQAIEKKMEKLREKESDLDSKSKTLREREKSFKVEEKSLEKETKQLRAEKKEDLLNVKAELENLRADIAKQQLTLNEKNEQLKVTKDERLEHERLQSELKQEINKCRLQNEQLLKEADDLKQEKERFEKEWEVLDDKRAEIKKELEDVDKQKIYFEKLRQSEEERLNNEKLETQQYLQRELEALKLAKDSFTASMEHEKSVLAEKSKSEKSQLLHEFELQKQEFETEMLRRQEEMESRLHDKERLFEEKRDAELDNINYLREVARREIEEMKLERNKIEKEKLEISHNKKHVESQQCEMKKDIEELIRLSHKLNDQREQFVKERERFIAFAEKHKNCSICGEIIREYMLSDLHPLTELESLEPPSLPRVAENYLKEAGEGTSVPLNSEFSPVLLNSGSPAAGGTISWFRKCSSKIFKFSPGKKLELSTGPTEAASDGRHVDMELPNMLPSSENEPQILPQVVDDSVDVEIMQSDSGMREVGADQSLFANQNQLSTPAKSQNFDVKKRPHGPGKGAARPRMVRTRSVKAAIAGAKAILGQSPKENENHYTNGSAENSASLNEETRAGSDFVGAPKNRRKRNHMLVSQATVSDDGYSEDHSNGVRDDDRRKKQHKVSVAEESFVEKRYNLRRPKVSVATMANGSLYESRKGKEKATDSKKGEEDKLSGLIVNSSEKVESGGASREGIHKPGAPFTLSRGLDGTDGEEPVKSTDAASAFSADSPVRYNIAGGTHEDHIDTAQTFVDGMDLIEEINGREEGARNYSGEEFESENCGEEDDDNDDGDDDEVNHPGEVSVGKKLWTFLTT